MTFKRPNGRIRQTKEHPMRKINLFSCAAAIFAFATASADAMGPGGGDLTPDESPYAILAPQTITPSWITERRASSYESNAAVGAANPNAPSWSPYAIMPQGGSRN
jgi:hypothetical protein